MTGRAFIAAGLIGALGAGAVAQPTAPPPTADPSRRPSSQTKPPEPTKPAQGQQTPNIQVIQLGPDGKPINPPPAGPTGFYYDDEARGGAGGGAGPGDEPQVIRYGPTPELHVVRSGDTLWDICFYYFNDPWQWPKVWSYNAQVTNPHWIYPGDLVRLLPRGTFASGDGGTGTGDGGTGGTGGTGGGTGQDVVPAPSRQTTVGLREIAFVERDDLEKTMRIVGSVDDKTLLTVNDQVYVSYDPAKPPRNGTIYSIYTAGNEVKKGGKKVGAYVHVKGQLKVLEVKKDKRARAVITDANSEIERGQLVGPLIRQFKNVPPVPAKVDATGTIVAMLTRDQLIGEGEVVFVDLGSKSGIEVGNRMYVIRRGDALDSGTRPDSAVGQDDKRFPNRALGQIVIVDVGKEISVGLVTLSVQEMGVGDQVQMQRSR